MKSLTTIYNRVLRISALIQTACIISILSSCEDFVKIDPPRTQLVRTTVFESDATATAAVLDIYYQMRSNGFASGDVTSISFFSSLSADEQINYYQSTPAITAEYQQFNDNTLVANNSQILSLWTGMYTCIYKANAVIEGLAISTGVSDTVRKQLQGEAKFIRAFCHFYLVNLFGDVPLVTTTDYRTNAEVPRTPTTNVYQQIIEDLLEAKNNLASDYLFAANERVRPNKGAAIALLARAYLYTDDWSNAEIQATEIISNTSLYGLTATLSGVFLVNSTEAILQWWNNLRPNDRDTFRFFDVPVYGALNPQLIAEFEDGDLRETTWTSLTPSGYYRTLKYPSAANNPPLQYSTVLRLAEQYLIRAEARTHLNNIAGAQEDINTIRNRAGLTDTPASDVPSLLLAIEKERRLELFIEWGNRWLDLKRTNRVDAILSPVKTQWVNTAALYPIPEYQLLNDPAMKNAQNPGY